MGISKRVVPVSTVYVGAFAQSLLLTLVSCGAPPRETPSAPAPLPLRLAERGGDVWGFSVPIEGTAPSSCRAVSLERGPITIRAAVQNAAFAAEMPLDPGDNVVEARCADPWEEEPATRVRYRVPIDADPVARVRLTHVADAILLDAKASTPNDGTKRPIVRFTWSDDPDNPEPLRTAGGVPLEGRTEARLELSTPASDGEYAVWLTVTDAVGATDRAGAYFVVEEGEPRVVDPAREPPSWLERAVVYGVVPSLFGDPGLDAVTARLPILADLGVNVLWLTPITAAPPGDFGYAVTDYFGVREELGSIEDALELVSAAHELRIRVIVDLVPNHTSDQHPYFLDAQDHGERSRYFHYYERDALGRPTHYFDWEHLPNLDYDEPEVRRWMREVVAFWVSEVDVDGFRVDAAWGVQARAPEVFADLRKELTRIEPRALLLGETSARHSTFVHRSFDAAYDWTSEVGEWAWENVFTEGAVNLDSLRRALTAEADGSRDGATVFRFLDNNDTGPRFVTRHGDRIERVAASLLFTLPGLPSLFTGQETGAEYEPYERERPLSWRPDPARFAFYRTLVRLRQEEPALHRGELVPVPATPSEHVFAFVRRGPGFDPVLVVLNFSSRPVEVRLRPPPEVAGELRRPAAARLLGTGPAPRRTGSTVRLELAPHDAAVWRLNAS